MLRVGLTGSIAVGKTHVSAVLAKLGCHVLDADEVARSVVLPGTPGLAAVVERFGAVILCQDGTLDRARLADLIFSSEKDRNLLNAILHPFIISSQNAQLNIWEGQEASAIAIVDAALMIESGGYRRFDKLIVVYCSEETQLQRMMARNNLSKREAEERIRAQLSQDEKKRYADYLINNSDDYDKTNEQVKRVYHSLKGFASGARPLVRF